MYIIKNGSDRLIIEVNGCAYYLIRCSYPLTWVLHRDYLGIKYMVPQVEEFIQGEGLP